MADRKALILIEGMGGGGAERMVFSLAGGLRPAFDVEFLVWTDKWVFPEIPGVKVSRIRSGLLPLQVISICRYFQRRNTDIVLAVMPSAAMRMFLVRLIVPFLNAKLLVNLHSVWTKERPYNAPGFWRAVRRRFFRLAVKSADKVIVISQEAKEDLAAALSCGNAGIAVVRNGVDKRNIVLKSGEAITDGVFPCPVPTIITVGRLMREKNHSLLIRAFALARKRKPCRLVLIGDGPDLPLLREQAALAGVAGDVLFVPFQPNPWKYMAAADMFALPSSYEGYPLVMLEAMLCKIPIITTDWGAALREITAGRDDVCLVVEKDNAARMADAMVKLLDDPVLAGRMKMRAFNHAMENLSDIADTVAAYQTEMESLLDGR